MPKDFSRTRRVGEQIQREIASLVQLEIQDPRIGLVTISGVKVSKDLSHATIYYTVLDDKHPVEETQKALDHASGFLRHELGKRMQLRIVPQLHFQYDKTLAYGNELSALITKAVDMENPDKANRDDPDNNANNDQGETGNS